MDFEFSWKFKDFEIRTIKSNVDNHPYIELVQWNQNDSGRRSCFVLAYFRRDKDGSYELHFVGDRPLRYIAEIDIGEIWNQLWLAQQMFEDAERKLRDD